MLHSFGLAVVGLIALLSAAQAQQKSAKDLITGTWTLLTADNVRSDRTRVPGFGALPDGTAKFGADGKYSVEITPNSSGHSALSYSGSYMLDDAGKTLTLRVEQSSLANRRRTTQGGNVEFVNADNLDHLGSLCCLRGVHGRRADLVARKITARATRHQAGARLRHSQWIGTPCSERRARNAVLRRQTLGATLANLTRAGAPIG
jgi:hypothetical protein